MNNNFDEELNAKEREAFDRLVREKQPPALLEAHVIRTLKEAQLLRPSKPQWRRRTSLIAGALAASLLIFVGGAFAGANYWTRPASTTPQFMLVLKAGSESSRPRSSEEIRRIVAEYSGWARGLREQGIDVDGEKLKDEIRVLGDDSSQQKRMNGYFLIGAHDFDQAVQIASGCPHLKYGGTIEVRQIDRF